MHVHAIVTHVESHVGHVQEIVGEIFLNDISLVSTTYDEIVDAMRGVAFQDMPQNRAPADLNHRLRADGSLFADACTKTASKNNCFHSFSSVFKHNAQSAK